MNRETVVIGESWNAKHLIGRFKTVQEPWRHGPECQSAGPIGWCLPYAIRAGAFAYGQSSSRLKGLGLHWDLAFNLSPPVARARDLDVRASARVFSAFTLYVATARATEREWTSVIVAMGVHVRDAVRTFVRDVAIECPDIVQDLGDELFTGGFVLGVRPYPIIRVSWWPHPSGLCRLWNDLRVMRAARACASAINDGSFIGGVE